MMSEGSKKSDADIIHSTQSAVQNDDSQQLPQTEGDTQFGNDRMFDDDLFSTFPEGTRIFIEGNTVTFENMTPDLLDVAQSLNPQDKNLAERTAKPRKKSRKKT